MSNNVITGWHLKTKLERILFVLSSCLALSVTGSGETNKEPSCKTDDSTEVCLSRSCINTASEIIRSLDETQNPCDDFYEFACGGWIRNNPIPEGKSSWGITSKVQDHIQLIIRNALEKVNTTDPKDAEGKARIYYDACIDKNKIKEKLGGKPLLTVIEKLGGWLPSTVHTDQKWDLQSLIQGVQNTYPAVTPFLWDITADYKNSSKRVITLGGLLSNINFIKLNMSDDKAKVKLDYMTRICVLLGANESEARAEMSKILEFKKELSKAITAGEQAKGDEQSYYHDYTIEEWHQEAPFLNWTMYFNDAFKLVNRTILSTERIIVDETVKKWIERVKKYIKTKEGQRILRSYMMWQVAESLSKYLSKSFFDTANTWDKANGKDDTGETWRFCVDDTDKALGYAVGAMFVRDGFHGEFKTQVKTMIYNIRKAFEKNFKNLKWMDDETRKAAATKVDAMTDMIGYPDFIMHKDELDKHYYDLIVDPNQHFENYLASQVFKMKNKLKNFDKPVDKTEFMETPASLNAYYLPNYNQMVILAGILQVPLYAADNPESVNYGAIGIVVGHELTHGFDDAGRQYDRFGNLKQWWNNATIEKFKKRLTCFEEEYSGYTMDGQSLDGKQTLGENIADNGGLKASFHAYLNYSQHAKMNLTLPGLKYNHRQLFFISFAQTWCQETTKKFTQHEIKADVHSLDKYRIIGSLSNLKEFSEEFKCPIGSIMNPKKKCELW